MLLLLNCCRPLNCRDRGFESHRGHGYLSVVRVVCCQVEVSATSWSLLQRSPTDCGASLCDLDTSRIGSPYIYIYMYIYDISSLRVNDLTLILLTWRKLWTPNNASKWQMGFNSAFKGLRFWKQCACSRMTGTWVAVWMPCYCRDASSHALNQWPERKDFQFIEFEKTCRLLHKWILTHLPLILPHFIHTP